MKITATQLEDFHVEERKFLCSVIDLRKVLLAQGWEPHGMAAEKTADGKENFAGKFKRGWETLAVDKRTDAGIWMWYRYNSAKMGGTLYDRITPDLSQLPHGDNAERMRSMEKVLKQNSLRQFAKQFVNDKELMAFYAPRKTVIQESIVQGEKILKGELVVNAQRESLLELAVKFGFKATERKGPRQYFEFAASGKNPKVVISVPVADPYVFIEHGETRSGGGVRAFKDRYVGLRQLDLSGHTQAPKQFEEKKVARVASYVVKEGEPAMAAESKGHYQVKGQEPAPVHAPMQGDLFQDLTVKRGR